MLVRFQNKSNRVKGLSFHPKRPWILASLHNGQVQLWDYRMESLIDKFEEHDGPVRGVHFHQTQPLFVSGGDDYKIKVWNYAQRRCLFNLMGHLDYIRTVRFHHEYPWILSASDDQTLRIWNWQSRQCLTVLTGHNHYVMCAQFHPSQDLLISASLDQTIRLWDFSGLRKKNVTISQTSGPAAHAGMVPGAPGGPSAELFGPADAIVRTVIEGHTRGVNWVSFHRTMPLIVSGADDREVKLWRMNDVRVWEVDTMRGHINNVSCVIFHPREDVVLSNSEDKTIRVWDISKQRAPRVLRRDNERYWILDAHPTKSLLAAGHDAGLTVFKLSRERPPMDPSKKDVYYLASDQTLCHYDHATKQSTMILSLKRAATSQSNPEVPISLQFNRANRTQQCVLLMLEATDGSSGSYELWVNSQNPQTGRDEPFTCVRGTARDAVFLSRNRFAVLDRQRTAVWIKDLKNETKRKITLANGAQPLRMFAAGTGRLLIRVADKMILYDVQTLKEVAEFAVSSRHPIKYVVWSPTHRYCAMFSKVHVYITDANLRELGSVTETTRIKSGSWDPLYGVFVYTTLTHIKYLLPNGDGGIIRSLDDPIYITSVSSTEMRGINRDLKHLVVPIDTTEYQFKVALLKRRFKDVRRIMQSNKLVGESIIAYLQSKGFPEVALHFVQDNKIKFGLALECGNIRVALECATALDQPDSWHRLGVEALRQGNHQVVEAAYQKTRNFERLSFLYLITGNTEKLAKMLQIASLRQDLQGQFHNSLYLGSIEDRVGVLRAAGQLGLALLTARAHGLDAAAESVEAAMVAAATAAATAAGEDAEAAAAKAVPTLPDLSETRLLFPPTPILRDANWPLIEVRQSYFDQAPNEEPVSGEEDGEEGQGDYDDEEGVRPGAGGARAAEDRVAGASASAVDDGWLRSDSSDRLAEQAKQGAAAGAGGAGAGAGAGGAGAGSGWGDGDDMLAGLGLELDAAGAGAADGDLGDLDFGAGAGGDADGYSAPVAGKARPESWIERSHMVADLVAAGAWDSAMEALARQIGACEFAPRQASFAAIYQAPRVSLAALFGDTPQTVYLERAGGLPRLPFSAAQCTEMLKAGAKAMTEGNFPVAHASFVSLLQTIPFVVVSQEAEEQELKGYVKICDAYITAIRLELERRQTEDPVRQCELAAYFTRCKLKPIHLMLGLRTAIKCAVAVKNFAMAGGFARRALELWNTSPNKDAINQLINIQQIRQVAAHCEKNNADAVRVDYQEGVAFELCCASFSPIRKGDPVTYCPYTGSAYKVEYNLEVDRTSGFCRIGAEASGLAIFLDPATLKS